VTCSLTHHLSPLTEGGKKTLSVVTPVKTGVQEVFKYLKILDSGFRRNDGKKYKPIFHSTPAE
jgi:hypothetical protein